MASLSLQEFEAVTHDAFNFLSKEHAYSACPVERGGHFRSAFVRRFVKGPFEVGVAFGDVDSEPLCTVWFRDDVDKEVAEHSYMHRELTVLLAQRDPSFAYPTRAHLSDSVTPESVIRQYADLTRRYALDVVSGDFSAFPTLVYVVQHKDRLTKVNRLLGVYSVYERATEAIETRKRKRGFEARADGFRISRVQIDGYGFWFAGIPLDSDHG